MRATLIIAAALAALGSAVAASAGQAEPEGLETRIAGPIAAPGPAPGVTVDFAFDLTTETRPPEAARMRSWRAPGIEGETLIQPEAGPRLRPAVALEHDFRR